jgi:hypothetical protein
MASTSFPREGVAPQGFQKIPEKFFLKKTLCRLLNLFIFVLH